MKVSNGAAVGASFNTQPREGGCHPDRNPTGVEMMFQHTAARRRLLTKSDYMASLIEVSTHSRAKAAAGKNLQALELQRVSTHSRAKAAAYYA